MVAIGSGGSSTVVAVACLLREQEGGFSKGYTPLEFYQSRVNVTKAEVLIATASGKNKDIIDSFKRAVEREANHITIVCSSQDSPIKKLANDYDFCDVFEFCVGQSDGYLATNTLLLQVTMLLRAYVKAHNLDSMPSVLPKAIVPDLPVDIENRSSFIVMHSKWSRPAAIDLESKFSEAALGCCMLTDYRNFGHGRHNWLDKRSDSTVIVALTNPDDEDLAKRTLSLVPENIPVVQVIARSQDHVACLELLMSVYELTAKLGKIRRIDPGRPGIPSYGSRLYRLSMLQKQKRSLKTTRETAVELASERKRQSIGLSPYDASFKQIKTNCKKFIGKLLEAQFSSIVFDYDGTLCSSRDRHTGLSKEVSSKIVKLVSSGLIVGIATGRGSSVHSALKPSIPHSLQSKVIIGCYNGSHIYSLDCEKPPLHDLPSDEILLEFWKSAQQNSFVTEAVTVELRGQQISFVPHHRLAFDHIYNLLKELMQNDEFSSLRLVVSSHSFDVIQKNVSKLQVVKACREAIGLDTTPVNTLCIGDQGAWPGNDFDLLSTPFGLSVDTVSSSVNTCWNLAPAGLRGVPATVHYINRLKLDKGTATFTCFS